MPVERCSFCYRNRFSFSGAISCGLLLKNKQSNLELNSMECAHLGSLLGIRFSKAFSHHPFEISIFYNSKIGLHQFIKELEKKGYRLRLFNSKSRAKFEKIEFALFYQFVSKKKSEINRHSLFIKHTYKPKRIMAAMCLVSGDYFK
ncbi:MAG: hypothetical protein N2440_00380 [Actinobacteria bacterium]|nr:hypothetical protein [Actinomycetota bacterium]